MQGSTGQTLPLVIFGTFTFLAGILASMLPETLNRSLPDSIKDAENFGKSVHRVSVPKDSTIAD